MCNIYIVGGNGFTRECYHYVIRMAQSNPKITFKGFLGEGQHVPDLKNLSKLFISDVSNFEFSDDDYAVIGSGEPCIRKRIYHYLKKRHVKLFNIVDPSVNLYEQVKLGEGNIITLGCNISCNVDIGNANLFNIGCVVGHDVKIGDFNFFAPNTQILGNVTVGNLNSIGTSSVMLPHSHIGNNNKISPLSAIYKGCKDNCIMHGNPALKVSINQLEE